MQCRRRFTLLLVELAAAEKRLGCQPFHFPVAGGVIEIAMGIDDIGKLARLKTDLAKISENQFLGIVQTTAVHQQRLFTRQQHELQWTTSDLALNHVNAVENL